MTDRSLDLSDDQLLTVLNTLEREKRRGKPTGREAADEAQRPVVEHLRQLRPDLNFHDAALFWYFGERPVVTYSSTVQAMGGGLADAPPPDAAQVRRLGCAFCGDQTGEDDAASLVLIEVRAVDGSYAHELGAHVWCLPDEIADRTHRDRQPRTSP